MPRDDDDGPLDEGKPASAAKPAAAKPPKFHPKFIKAAEDVGLSPEDIDNCRDTAELRELISLERENVRAEQARQPGRARDRSQQQQPASPPPPPSPEPEYKFDAEDMEIDPKIRGHLAKLFVKIEKATKKGDKDRVEALEEEIAALKDERETEKRRNHPMVRRAHKVLDKYSKLFGTREDREDNPTGSFAVKAKMVEEYVFGEMQEQGKFTGVPEKDIPAAIADLFPSATPAGKDAQPATQNGTANGTQKTRADQWADSGTPPTSHRNGTDRTGKPGGKRAAAAKVREKLLEDGYDYADDSDDLGDDEEI